MASNYITAIRTSTGDKQIDYEALANKPKKFTSVDVGGTKIVSNAEFDTLSFTAGEGISLTPDIDNKTINVDISDTLVNTMTQDVSSMLISSKVKELYELKNDATLDEILTFLRHTITTRLLNIYVYTGGGSLPLENVAVSGDIVDTNGNTVTMYTNENGYLISRISDDATSIDVTATYKGSWSDIKSTKTVKYKPSDKMVQTLIIYMDRNTSKVVNTSSDFKLSPEVSTLNVGTAGGGGGGGGTATSHYTYETWDDDRPDYVYDITSTLYGGGGGGGGGYVANETIILEEKENTIDVVVGTGGLAGQSKECRYGVNDTVETTVRGGAGNSGSATYITIDGVNYAYASGGDGGTGGFATAGPSGGGHSGGAGGSGNGAGGAGGYYAGAYYNQWGNRSYYDDGGKKGGDATTSTLLYSNIKAGGGGAGRGYNSDKVFYEAGGSPYGGSSSSGRNYGGGGAGAYNGYQGVAVFNFEFRNKHKEE